MDHEEDILTPLEALVAGLVDWTGLTVQMVDHMRMSQAVTGQRRPSIPEVLCKLIAIELEEMAERRPFEFGVAADVLRDVTEHVADNIFMVPIEQRPAKRSKPKKKRKR